MRMNCVVVSLVLLTASSARAQSDSRSLSESEFTSRYKRAEPRFEIGAAEVAASRARVALASRLENPAIEIERESVNDETESFAGLSWSLDLGGRSARIDSARSSVRASQQRASHERHALIVDALHHYYTAVAARDRVVVLESSRKALSDVVAVVRSQTKAGEAAGYNLDRLELALARYDEDMASASSDLTVALVAVSKLLGKPEVSFDVTGTLSTRKPASLEVLQQQASQERADWRAARARAESASLAGRAAGRWWVPAIGITGGVKTVQAAGDTNTGYMVAVKLELPIFDRNQHARLRARADQQREGALLEVLATSISSDVRTAHGALTATLERLDGLESEQLPRAEKLVSRAALMFREGELNVVEYLDAQETVLKIRLRHLSLKRLAKTQELDLQRALGRIQEGS